MADIESFLDEVEGASDPMDVVERRREVDEDIDQLVMLASKHRNGETTHRSIAAQMDIGRGVTFRALSAIPDALDWDTGTQSTTGEGVDQERVEKQIRAAKKDGLAEDE